MSIRGRHPSSRWLRTRCPIVGDEKVLTTWTQEPEVVEQRSAGMTKGIIKADSSDTTKISDMIAKCGASIDEAVEWVDEPIAGDRVDSQDINMSNTNEAVTKVELSQELAHEAIDEPKCKERGVERSSNREISCSYLGYSFLSCKQMIFLFHFLLSPEFIDLLHRHTTPQGNESWERKKGSGSSGRDVEMSSSVGQGVKTRERGKGKRVWREEARGMSKSHLR
ncbi:hypothetical protein ACLOJK_008430 [Asimina triloba]